MAGFKQSYKTKEAAELEKKNQEDEGRKCSIDQVGDLWVLTCTIPGPPEK